LWCLQHWTFHSESLWLSRSFVFPYVFQDWFFYFCAECHWSFDRDCIEHFGSMAIFTMLILPILEHGSSFHFCCPIQFFSSMVYSFH
jgi:hypothetical protein